MLVLAIQGIVLVVRFELQPLQVVEDGGFILGSKSAAIVVIQSQNDSGAARTCNPPNESRMSDMPEVQPPGDARRKACDGVLGDQVLVQGEHGGQAGGRADGQTAGRAGGQADRRADGPTVGRKDGSGPCTPTVSVAFLSLAL